MRLFKRQFTDDETKAIARVLKMFGMEDNADWAEDMVCAFLGDEVTVTEISTRAKEISDENKAKLAADPNSAEVTSVAGISAYLLRKNSAFKTLLATKYGQYLRDNRVSGSTANAIVVMERVLSFFRSFVPNVQVGRCSICRFSGECDYGSAVIANANVHHGNAPTRLIGDGRTWRNSASSSDLPTGKDIHRACPCPPFDASGQQLIAGLLAGGSAVMAMTEDEVLSSAMIVGPGKGDSLAGTLEQIAAEVAKHLGRGAAQTSGPVGEGTNDSFDATFSGAVSDPTKFEEAVKRISMRSFVLSHLSGKMAETIEANSGVELEDTQEPDRRKPDIRTVTDMEQIRLVPKGQLALREGDMLDKAVATGDIQYEQDRSPQQRRKLFYFLVDASGSMGATIGANHLGLLTRSDLAASVAIALAHKQFKDNGLFFLRWFEGSPGALYRADDPAEFQHVCRMLAVCDANGGGTNIARAVKRAEQDIREGTEHGNIGKAEIVVISDGDDTSGDYDEWKAIAKDIGLHYLEVADYADQTEVEEYDPAKHNNNSRQFGHTRMLFKAVASSFQIVDPANVDFDATADAIVQASQRGRS